jgi:hypothetical protein
MPSEEVSDFLQKICTDNDLQLLTKIPKYEKKNNCIFGSNMNDLKFDKYINTNTIKTSSEKVKQRKRQLIEKQLKNIPFDKKIRKSDIDRIIKHTPCSIFDSEKCCIWDGYITNINDPKKGTYINFYFKNKKKVALHRLLYINFKGPLNNTDYIKYSCDNKGKCCNINHMIRFEYNFIENNKKHESKQDKYKLKEFTDNDNFKISFF